MKKLKLFAMGVAAMLFATTGVKAAEIPKYAKNNGDCTVDNITDLKEAFSVKWTNDKGKQKTCTDIIIAPESTITLDGDLTFDKEITFKATEGNSVLDLNGYKITFTNDNYFEIFDSANITLKNGTIVYDSTGGAAIEVSQGASLTTSKLTINVTAGPDDELGDTSAIDIFGLDAENVAKLVTSADTVINAPLGHGLLISEFTQISLNGTWNTGLSVIANDGVTKTTNVTFEGGNYTAKTGIVVPIIKGHWTFNGGTFVSNNDDAINIGKIPVDKTGAKKTDVLIVAINEGVFETKDAYHKPIHSVDLTGFVYGGAYKAPSIEHELPSSYIAETYNSYVDNAVTYVGLESAVRVNTPTHGKVTSDKENAIAGQTVTITLAPDEGYVPEITLVDKDGKAVEYKKAGNVLTFVMPASEVTVTVTFEEKADYTALDEALAKAIEIDPTSYTDESYAALAAAIEKAYALDGGLSKTHQDEIDAITEQINNAIEGLKDLTAGSGTPEIPNTLDSVPVYFVGGAIAIASLLALGFTIKKKLED